MAAARDVNLETWRRRRTVAAYRGEDGLQPAEKVLLERLEPEIRGGAILDLGVGAGRTTPFLTRISSDYVGIDYSPEMIDACRRRFPEVDFRCRDARDLSCFEAGRFDFVLFSYNGLDYVSHPDRLSILAAIRRILKDGGVLAFSSHNLELEPRAPRWRPEAGSWNPLRLARGLGRWLVELGNHLRLRPFEHRGSDHAVRNDPGINYSLLTYYIRPADQVEQLRRLGYRDVKALGLDGRPLAGPERGASDCEPSDCEPSDCELNPWVYYLARKKRRP